MNERRDPFEMLRALTGERFDRSLEPGDDARAEEMLRAIIDRHESAAAPSTPRRRWRVWVGGLMAVTVVGGSAVVAASWWRRPADATILQCYSEASIPPALRAGLTIDPAQTSVEQCAPLWSDGTLSTEGPPALVACVSEQDNTAVMPGDPSTCSQLGLAVADQPTIGDNLDARVALAVPELFLDRCEADLQQMRREVEALLAELGATDWTVRIDGSTSTAKPCAANAVDGTTREILILPFEGFAD